MGMDVRDCVLGGCVRPCLGQLQEGIVLWGAGGAVGLPQIRGRGTDRLCDMGWGTCARRILEGGLRVGKGPS